MHFNEFDIFNILYRVLKIAQHAKKEISHNPAKWDSICVIIWIEKTFPSVTEMETRLVFLKLVEDGYLFLPTEICLPSGVIVDELDIMKFILMNNLSRIDHGILHELNKFKRTSCRINDLSMIVFMKNWHNNTNKIKNCIHKLYKNNIIIAENGALAVNWKLIRSVFDENNPD